MAAPGRRAADKAQTTAGRASSSTLTFEPGIAFAYACASCGETTRQSAASSSARARGGHSGLRGVPRSWAWAERQARVALAGPSSGVGRTNPLPPYEPHRELGPAIADQIRAGRSSIPRGCVGGRLAPRPAAPNGTSGEEGPPD